MFRIGFGYDVHKLAEGETLILGGVRIPYIKGTVGHSDADVLVHAIIDAILGAANMRDIGWHFPDTDPKYAGISSLSLLSFTIEKIRQKGYDLVNIDATVVLQKPKIKNFIPQMKLNIAQVLKINSSNISIKATTTEFLGFEGRGEGISAYAVVLLIKKQ